jgi:hypothetical protein
MTPELDFDSIYQWKRIAQGEHIASRDGWTFRRSIQEETYVYHDYSRSWRYMRAPSSESKHDDIDSD